MFNNIRGDLNAYSKNGSHLKKIKLLLIEHTIHLTLLYRLSHWLKDFPIFGIFFSKVVEYIIRVVYASDISYKATIGHGLIFAHGHDIVIGADVVIGEYCTIFNGVSLGNKDLDASSTGSQPKVGNNVIVATGAKVLGQICIGDNVIIGANSVVIEDIPSDVTVVGIPARVVNKKI